MKAQSTTVVLLSSSNLTRGLNTHTSKVFLSAFDNHYVEFCIQELCLHVHSLPVAAFWWALNALLYINWTNRIYIGCGHCTSIVVHPPPLFQTNRLSTFLVIQFSSSSKAIFRVECTPRWPLYSLTSFFCSCFGGLATKLEYRRWFVKFPLIPSNYCFLPHGLSIADKEFPCSMLHWSATYL